MRILVFILALFIAMPAMADETIFRNFVWGASKDDVHQFEKAKFYKEEGDSLFFVEKEGEFRRVIRYDFKGGKLWGARYEFQELHVPHHETALNMYYDEERRLEKEYGATVEEKFTWKDKTYRNYPQFWSRALASGDLRVEAVWQVNDTKITLQCFHDGMFFQLFYTLELTDGKSAQDTRTISGLPATQKSDTVSRP